MAASKQESTKVLPLTSYGEGLFIQTLANAGMDFCLVVAIMDMPEEAGPIVAFMKEHLRGKHRLVPKVE